MTLKADTAIETVPAIAEVIIDRIRLTRIDIKTHPKYPYAIELVWLRGYADAQGDFVATGRDMYETEDMALIGPLMLAPTLDGETAAAAIERLAFQILQNAGIVPAGSIEI